jgi:hypothetical protein
VTFEDVLKSAGFERDGESSGAVNWGLGARPRGLVIPHRSIGYRLVDDNARAVVSWFGQSCSMSVSMREGPGEFRIVGYWDDPGKAGQQLAAALYLARKRVV